MPLGAAEDLSAAIAACRTEQDDARRLACYDRQADRLAERASTAAAAPVAPAAAATQGAEAAVAGTVAAAATSATPAANAPAAQSAATAGAAPNPVTPQDEFGYGGAMARTDQKKNEGAAQALEEMVATVTQVSARQRGELVITLDNGQVWVQKTPESSFHVKIGDQVRIKTGALRSYMMSHVTSDRATRVTRVR
jgi:hypothetical protein